MKVQTIFLLAFLQLAAMCQKDKEVNPKSIDLKNPTGRLLYFELFSGIDMLKAVAEFAPPNNLIFHTTGGDITITYTRIDDHTIHNDDLGRLEFDPSGKVTASNPNYSRVVLLPHETSSQLKGKTFSGSLTIRNGNFTQISPKKYYRFLENENKVAFGNSGSAPERTNTYEAFGAFGARVILANGDTELLVLVDDTLEVSQYNQSSERTWRAEMKEEK